MAKRSSDPHSTYCLAMAALLLHTFIPSIGGSSSSSSNGSLDSIAAAARHCTGTPLFVFGASMMDVGENAQAMPLRSRAEFPPYGIDYFPKPSRRFSNGRLIVDFLSQGLGNGLGDPFLLSTRPSFTCGVNFASSGAHIANTTVSGDGSSSIGLFSMSVQIDQFRAFKSRLNASRFEDLSSPSLQDFIDGVYLLEFGHNDYTKFVDLYPAYNTYGNVSNTLATLETGLKRLHAEGAMNIVVMNLIPLGCTPLMLAIRDPPTAEQDEYGCFAAFNEFVDLHNAGLEDLLQQLADELPSANWTLFDINSIFWDAIQDPEKYGLKYYRKACCGAGGGDYNVVAGILCGQSGYIDGVYTRAWRCDDPSLYMFWDTIHPVESFAKIVANGFLTGEYLRSFTASTARMGLSCGQSRKPFRREC